MQARRRLSTPGTAVAAVVVVGAAVVLWARLPAVRSATRDRRAVRVVAVVLAVAAVLVIVVPTAFAAAALLPPRGVATGPPAPSGLTGTEARFATSDGIRLAGWWSPGTNGAAVVLVPGTYGTRNGVVGQAVVLARHGYGVLLLDPHADGLSADPERWETTVVGFLDGALGP